MQKRYAFFYLIGTLCNGLSGVLAYGLQQMVSLSRPESQVRPQSNLNLVGWNRGLRRLEMDLHH